MHFTVVLQLRACRETYGVWFSVAPTSEGMLFEDPAPLLWRQAHTQARDQLALSFVLVLAFPFYWDDGGSLWLLFVGCLTSQQHANVYQGRICSDNFTCCHTEIEAADPTSHLTQSQYTDTGPTSPSPDPITPGTWQSSHWSADF